MAPTLRSRVQKPAKRAAEHPRRPAIPSTALKRAAAASFQGYESDPSDGSPTKSESEAERLARYPAKRRPSPRKNVARMKQQLDDARRRESGRKALKAEMEDEASGLVIRSRGSLQGASAKLGLMPLILPEAAEAEDEDAKPGSGQVFLDGAASIAATKVHLKSTKKAKRKSAADVSSPPKSDMGLFASLPGELRNRIYRFALVEGDGQPFLVSMKKETCNLGPCEHTRLPAGFPGILSACKQIRAESMPIFVAENSFKFDDELAKARCVPNWLRSIGDYGGLLSTVILDIVCWEVPVDRRATSTEKVEVHYEMALRWKKMIDGIGRWSLVVDKEIAAKAPSEYSTLDNYIGKLDGKILNGKLTKEMALREFVWSDWLAKLIWICRK